MKKMQFKGHTAEIINYLFQALLITYLLLLLIEQVWAGSVSLYMKLNYLLIAVIVTGILDVFSEHEKQAHKETNWKDYVYIVLLGILGFAIIKFKTAQLGWLSWLISIIAGILIILLSLLVLEEDEAGEKRENQERKSFLDAKTGWTLGILIALLVLSLITSLIGLFTSLNYAESFRIVFGSIYVLFLPGFIISYIFFPKTREFDSEKEEEKKERGGIDWIERIALSFALSIAIVPLAVFYLNLIGIKINLLNSSLIILGIIVLSLIVLYCKERKRKVDYQVNIKLHGRKKLYLIKE